MSFIRSQLNRNDPCCAGRAPGHRRRSRAQDARSAPPQFREPHPRGRARARPGPGARDSRCEMLINRCRGAPRRKSAGQFGECFAYSAFATPNGRNAHDRRHNGNCYGPPGRCEELDGPGLQIPCRRHCEPTGERLFADIRRWFHGRRSVRGQPIRRTSRPSSPWASDGCRTRDRRPFRPERHALQSSWRRTRCRNASSYQRTSRTGRN